MKTGHLMLAGFALKLLPTPCRAEVPPNETKAGQRIGKWLSILLFLSTLNPQLSTGFAQGSLTPPGAPAPTMKTLQQVEPRTPISSVPLTITQPGSYYLTANVTVSSGDAITIVANGVTLDLNGFTISSTAPVANGSGILISNFNSVLSDIIIYNGHISGSVTNDGFGTYGGSGFNSGIESSGYAPGNVRVTGISVSGCLQSGIDLDPSGSTLVESCTVRNVGSFGIAAGTVKGSLALICGAEGIDGSHVSDCEGESSGSGDGIFAMTAQNCTGRTYGGYGNGLSAMTAQNCYGLSGGAGDGIHVTASANNCNGSASSANGISVTDGGVLIGCTATSSEVGIKAGNGCTIKDCTALDNLTNGIIVGQGCRLVGCTASGTGYATGGVGISADIRTTIEDCTANDNFRDGIQAQGDCTILNNHASHNGIGLGGPAAGIHTAGSGSRIDGNQTRDNTGYGIKSDGGPNADMIVRNTSGNNGLGNFSPSTGNAFAPIQNPANLTNTLGNIVF